MSLNCADSSKRTLTQKEIGSCVRLFRELRKWSQEQLAEISGLNVRTIQRVEQGLGSSLDTRRGIARAFDFDDLDFFDKSFSIPSEEDLNAEKQRFNKQNVTLTAIPLTTGKQLAKQAECCMLDMFDSTYEMSREAEETFAALTDYFREYRDAHELFNETDKFAVFDELQSYLDILKAQQVGVCYATRKVQLKWKENEGSVPTSILYIVCCPINQMPETLAVRKRIDFKF